LISTDFASISPYAGAELGYQKMIFVRLGINRFQSITDIEDLKEKFLSSLVQGLESGIEDLPWIMQLQIQV
jgi:hypothetical protein